MLFKNKLAIFDLDGTLFDTRNANFFSYKKALDKYEIYLDYEYFCKECNGKKYTTFLPDICGFNDERIKEIHEDKKLYYSEFLSKVKVNNELFDIIEQIKKKYYICLVTTASKKNTYDILSYFDKKEIFDLILTQDDIHNPKPNPEGFIRAIEHFKVLRENVIIFEDSDVGVEAALKCTSKVYIVKGFN